MEGISEWRLGIVACFGIASFASIFSFRLSVHLHLGLFSNICFLFYALCTRLLPIDDSIDALADTSSLPFDDSVFI